MQDFDATLGFKDHEMDFELNLIFTSQVFRHFENFRVLCSWPKAHAVPSAAHDCRIAAVRV